MEPFVALLVLISAVMHPLWNLLIKQDGHPLLSFLGLTATMALWGLVHAFVTGEPILGAWALWPLLLLSIGGQLLYGIGLTATLRRGDLSAYYPIIRASPVFIVLVGVLFLGRSYPALVLLGIFLAVAGGALLLYRRGSHVLADPLTLGLALMAMAGTGIYSLSDSEIAKTVSPQVLMFWVEGSLVPFYFLLYRATRHRHPAPKRLWTPRRWLMVYFLPGTLSYASYFLILLAYGLGGEVAAVTAVRQASIPISVILGGYFLREGAILRRFAASLLLALGIVLIILFGQGATR